LEEVGHWGYAFDGYIFSMILSTNIPPHHLKNKTIYPEAGF
jgi:hypothetical protein